MPQELADSSSSEDFPSLDGNSPHLPPEFTVDMHGCRQGTPEERRQLHDKIKEWTGCVSRALDLTHLESVIVADDYQTALAAVDRNDSQFPPLVPTDNEHGQGAVMAFMVVRKEDELWSVVVAWAPVFWALVHEGSGYADALATLLHELRHVHDTQIIIGSCPEGWRETLPQTVGVAQWEEVVHPCQSEYCAQRFVSYFVPGWGQHYLQMLRPALMQISDQLRAAREEYLTHREANIIWFAISPRLKFLFQVIGYFSGHCDGLARQSEENADWIARYEAEWQELGELPAGWLLDKCRVAVRPFYDLQSWPGDGIYDSLNQILDRLLKEHGLFVDMSWGRINIFTEEPAEEQIED